MGPLRAVFIVAVIYVACSWNHAHAEPEIEPTEYKPSGGGKCDSDLDCGDKGKGMCVNKGGKDAEPSDGDDVNAECVCETGRDGEHCEKEDKKPSRRQQIDGLRKTNQAAEKRYMQFDLSVPATGLSPEEIQNEELSILFFHPRTGRYVEVSDNTPFSGAEKGNKFLKLDASTRGRKKFFRLEKDAKNDKSYYIAAWNEEDKVTNGYVYVSKLTKGIFKHSNRLMLTKTKDQANAFTFIENSIQGGIYKMKHKQKYVYGSAGDFNIKADDRDAREKSEEIWFQINLIPTGALKPKDIQVDVTNTNKGAFNRNNNLEVTGRRFKNDKNEDYTVQLDREEMINTIKTKFDQLVASASGGVEGGVGNIGLSVSKERSTTDQYSKTTVDKNFVEIKVSKQTKVCVDYSYSLSNRYDEEELKITVKGTKVFKGYKTKMVGAEGDVTMAVKDVGLNEVC